LYKKGKKDNVENYRPISLTCICCKIMESIICHQLMNFFLTNNLFCNNQYGFVKGRSVVLQLLNVVDHWTDMLDRGQQIDVIYTDFEKAFDKVPHKRLLSKLHAYGIHEELINWVKSFLEGRMQRVRIKTELSTYKPVLSGIPQGSVLGPLLFVIFINDLPDICNNLSDLFIFADDAKLYKSICNQLDSDVLNECFQNILNWSDNWLMKLNISKCKVLSLCSNKNKSVKYTYGAELPGVGFSELEHVDSIKDLGVTMDCELLFNMHIYDKINIAYKMLGIIKRNFKDVDNFAFITLYKSFVRSHVEYANSVWCPHGVGVIQDLEKVQKRATKNVQGCKGLMYEDRLTYLQLPSLSYRRLRGSMIETYKIVSGLYSACVAPVIPSNFDTRTHGNVYKFLVRRCRLDVRKFSFCNRVVEFWNSLPNSVVNSVSVNCFKNNLDKFCKQENMYYAVLCSAWS